MPEFEFPDRRQAFSLLRLDFARTFPFSFSSAGFDDRHDGAISGGRPIKGGGGMKLIGSILRWFASTRDIRTRLCLQA
ncbi:hypothetical protein [Bradyrhizobium sp. DOA1]|uniref:hypothetical protein n=1 Tax=Bradyrhizobium sp. DOA1 TaxID=1126616 RepID=UPI0012E88247|nr:hypothetical protein [Bradyrhizobium sp. DOA1]